MTTVLELLKQYHACAPGLDWFREQSPEHQADKAWLWDNAPDDHFVWAACRLGILDDRTLRLLACKFVRLTPIGDGKTVWDRLTDERSRNAVIVAERFAEGKATKEELKAAGDAAGDAARAAAWVATWDAARAAMDAAWVAARAAARAAMDAGDAARAAMDAAWAFQAKLIRDTVGNPFKEAA